MEVQLRTRNKITDSQFKAIGDFAGFDPVIDDEDGDYYEDWFYYIGDNPQESDKDLFGHDACAKLCGFVEALIPEKNIVAIGIDGEGDWAAGMMRRKDFSGIAGCTKSNEHTSRIYWKAYNKQKCKNEGR